MVLSNGQNYTHVYNQSGNYWVSTKSYGYAIRIPSNTYFHSQATIYEITNDFKYACLLSENRSSNITIDGGKYIGDVEKHPDLIKVANGRMVLKFGHQAMCV